MPEETRPAGTKDAPTVDAAGRELSDLFDGVEVVRLRPLTDGRGSLTQFLSTRDPFWREAIVHAYSFVIRPGRIKGWGMHRLQADRYFVAGGRLRVVLFDGRVGSPTFECLRTIWFTDETPGLLRIPAGVWHADQNWGLKDVRVANFPTRAYDASDPDKYRIDPHSGEIPFDWTIRDG